MMKKAQTSIEFIVLIGFTLVIVTTMTITFNQIAEEQKEERLEEISNNIYNILRNEVETAQNTQGNYSREFYLPLSLGDYDYEIDIHDEQDVEIRIRNESYVYFLIEPLEEAHINKGDNKIERICDESECFFYLNKEIEP